MNKFQLRNEKNQLVYGNGDASEEFCAHLRMLQKAAYDNAVAHGWWDKERATSEMLLLLHSEVSEAWECLRTGKIDTVISGKGKPEGFFTEIADVVIRIMDMAGGAKIDITDGINEVEKFPYSINTEAEFLLSVHEAISLALESIRDGSNSYERDLTRIVVRCFGIDCHVKQVDSLMAEIERKHEYNKSRPYRHGGKVL